MEDDVMNRVEAAGEEGFDLTMVGIRRKDYRNPQVGTFLCSLFNECTGGGGAGSTTSDSHSSYASSSRLEKHMSMGIYKTIQIMKNHLITSSLLSHHHLCFTSYHFTSYHMISVIAFTAQYQKHFSLYLTLLNVCIVLYLSLNRNLCIVDRLGIKNQGKCSGS